MWCSWSCTLQHLSTQYSLRILIVHILITNLYYRIQPNIVVICNCLPIVIPDWKVWKRLWKGILQSQLFKWFLKSNKPHHTLQDGCLLFNHTFNACLWSEVHLFHGFHSYNFKPKLTSTLLSIPTKNVISAIMSTNTRLRWILLRLQWRLYRHNMDRNARIKAIRDRLSPRYVITSNTTRSDTRLCKKKENKNLVG